MRKSLLTYLSARTGEFFRVKELAKKLKIKKKDDFQRLRTELGELELRGTIIADEKGRVAYNGSRGERSVKKKQIIGRLSVNRRGVGFVPIEGADEDIVVPSRFLGTALHGDIVEVSPFAVGIRRGRGGRDDRMEGEIVRVVERSLKNVVGTLERNRNFTFVVPDDQRISRDIYVAGGPSSDHGKTGDKVIVELLPWEDEHLNPEGKIIEVLGRAGDVRVEVTGVARAFGLPTGFSAGVAAEAKALPGVISSDEIARRLDLRSKDCVTIDPEDAKDFDDALSLEPLGDDLYRLGVHIADVSHYVRTGSALDHEAYERGTSVYMVNEVVPMLPERLSNDLCSLRPDQDRLAYSVLIDITDQGSVKSYTIRKSVIHSVRRFTYEEVQEVLNREKGEHAGLLLGLWGIAKKLLKKREKDGSIDFDTAEAKFVFDSQGFPSAIRKKERLDAHRLVEECMLLANKTVAQHIGRVRGEDQEKPFVYRIHDAPDPSRLRDLANFVKQFGFSLDVKTGVSSRALQKLMNDVKGSEVDNLIHEVALRSMAKAVYATKNIGHYGLAFKYYTHFTSPIRRYPDLVVHRLLHEYETKGRKAPSGAGKDLQEICRQATARERIAIEAERESVKVMRVEYMKRHIGDEFDGVIGGVTEFGLFVEINDLLVEGLIRVRDMADDYYLFDEKHYALRGRSGGRTYRLGDRVRVRVNGVNPQDRAVDFVLVLS
jgi:ribonuclease R